MQSDKMLNIKKVFEEAVLQLCQKLSAKDIKRLDAILTQSPSPNEIISNIVVTFPQFSQIFNKLLNQYLYVSSN